ncbi:MAG: sigma-70 family RNA polymerase sigma factor, partial [Coprobacillus sp.]
DSLEHEKAWFILTASNTCKDMLKHWWRKGIVLEDNISTPLETFQIDTTLDTILKLPSRYKTVIYLYYYEEYTTKEISEILHIPPSTVRNQLARARKILKRKLGDIYE